MTILSRRVAAMGIVCLFAIAGCTDGGERWKFQRGVEPEEVAREAHKKGDTRLLVFELDDNQNVMSLGAICIQAGSIKSPTHALNATEQLREYAARYNREMASLILKEGQFCEMPPHEVAI